MIESLVWCVLNVYFEARGEELEGQILVAHTVFNRAKQRKMNFKDVIQEDRQYSWFNDKVVPEIIEPLRLVGCATAVFHAWCQQKMGQNHRGLNHYHATWLKKWPYWADELEVVAISGDHIFYTDR